MMKPKTLLILRHAKSTYPDGVGDYDRPLAKRGLRDRDRIADMMAVNEFKPSLVLCSSAKRAMMTFDPLDSTWANQQVEIRDDLYHAASAHLLQTIQDMDDHHDTAMLVGHNPGLHDLINGLLKEAHPKDLKKLAYKFKTGAMAALSFEMDRWADIQPKTATLSYLFEPKEWYRE